MRIALTISLLIALAACNKHTVPTQLITQYKDTTITRYEYRDTVMRIPGETITIHDTIPAAKEGEAIRYLKEVKGKKASLKVDLSNNQLHVECNVDSLEQIIRGLNEKIINTKSVVVEKPVEVPVPTPYIPKWIWWALGILAALAVWGNRKYIIGLFKILLSFG